MSTSAADARQAFGGGIAVVGERDDLIGPDGTKFGQAFGVPAGADDTAGTEVLGDLDRHRARVAGGTEHEDRLAGPEGDATAKGDPGRHGRVHGRGDLDHVDVLRQRNHPAQVDERPLGHGTPDVVRADEVHALPVSESSHPVDPGDHGQGAGARVVAARRVGSDPRVQSGGQDVDEDLVRVRWARGCRRPRSGEGGRRIGPRLRACSCRVGLPRVLRPF